MDVYFTFEIMFGFEDSVALTQQDPLRRIQDSDHPWKQVVTLTSIRGHEVNPSQVNHKHPPVPGKPKRPLEFPHSKMLPKVI